MIRGRKDSIIGSEFWLNSENLPFSEIISISRIPDRWRRFDIIEDEYKTALIKPVNRYVSNLYPKPELISIDGLSVVLRQKTHAEIWVKPSGDDLYALDKTWQRQFYPSPNKYENNECFKATYKFYIPWIIDADISAKVTMCSDSPFFLNEQKIDFYAVPEVTMLDTQFVDFKIKTTGNHMEDERYGIIDISTSMYDLHFEVSEEQLEKLVNQYGR